MCPDGINVFGHVLIIGDMNGCRPGNISNINLILDIYNTEARGRYI